LIVDPLPFNPSGTCEPGGIYFARINNIAGYITSKSRYLREVTIPEDAHVYLDPDGEKWKANKVIIGARRDLKLVATWEYMLTAGMNLSPYGDMVILDLIVHRGWVEVIKYLATRGVDPHAAGEWMLYIAIEHGQLEIVKYLLADGINFNYHGGSLVRKAIACNQLEILKFLETKLIPLTGAAARNRILEMIEVHGIKAPLLN
jgi:hypothetical protein